MTAALWAIRALGSSSRQFGEPVGDSVRTEIISEQVRAGEPIDAIAELYDLPRPLVEAAGRYELVRSGIAA